MRSILAFSRIFQTGPVLPYIRLMYVGLSVHPSTAVYSVYSVYTPILLYYICMVRTLRALRACVGVGSFSFSTYCYCYCYWGLKVQGFDKAHKSGTEKTPPVGIPTIDGLSTLRDSHTFLVSLNLDYGSALCRALHFRPDRLVPYDYVT